MPQHFQIVSGPHNRTDLGLHIGGTYFAVYDNNVLTEVMNADGVGFDTSTWEHVRQEWRDPLARVGLAKQGYDTGKLLNAMLIVHGHTLHYADAPALVHLGGTSFVPLQPQHKRWWEDLPGVTVLRRWRSQWAIHDHFSRRSAAPEEVKAKTNLRLEQRNIVRSYFWHALQSLAAGQPLPALPQSGDLEILDRLSDAAARLEQTYRRFGIQTATDVVTESSILA